MSHSAVSLFNTLHVYLYTLAQNNSSGNRPNCNMFNIKIKNKQIEQLL